MKKLITYNTFIDCIFKIECNLFNNNIFTKISAPINIIALIALAILGASQQNPIKGILPIILLTTIMWPLVEAVTDDKIKWLIRTARDLKNPRKQYQSWNI